MECRFTTVLRQLIGIAFIPDHGVRGAMDVQHGYRGSTAAEEVLNVACTGQAGHGAQTGQSLASHVIRHEPAVGITKEEHWPKVLDGSCLRHQISQIGDVILTGFASITTPVGGVPEAVSLTVECPVGHQ